ncbi:MAG: hypothetical protein JWR18_804 [Segetibacter sp.]|jgi:hypothetical protein|nr:hypothetical protein [Segetibacter sp.]
MQKHTQISQYHSDGYLVLKNSRSIQKIDKPYNQESKTQFSISIK